MKLGLGSEDSASEGAAEKQNRLPFETEVRDALENLGYTNKEITQSLKRVGPLLKDDPTIEDVIEAILRSFSG